MGLISWLIVGLVAGFLARLALPGEEPGPRGVLGDLISGIVGAVVGGWIFGTLGIGRVTGVNIGSIIIAFVGAVVFLLIWRAIVHAGHRRHPV